MNNHSKIDDMLLYYWFYRYRDPKTGLPYATKEAFSIIRERYFSYYHSYVRYSSQNIEV